MPLDRSNYRTPGGKISAALDYLEKGKAAVVFQLRSGNCPLNHFLKRIQAVDDARCPHCWCKETTVHFLFYCPKYRRERRNFRNALKEAEIKTDTRTAEKLLDNPDVFPYLADYVVATNRFEHLQAYIESDE